MNMLRNPGLYVFIMMIVLGCSAAANKQLAKTVIDVGLAACIAEHPGTDEPTLRAICQWSDELAPLVKQLIGAQKRGAAKGCSQPNSSPVSSSDAGKD